MLHVRSSLPSLLATLILGLALVSSALAQSPTRTVSNTVSLASDGEVTLNNHEGRITVTTWDRDAVRYEAQIMPTDEDPTAEKVTIRTRTRDHRVQIATVHKEGDDESKVFGFDEDGFRWGGINIPAVHYTVTMPRTAALSLNDHESQIDVTGLEGRLRIDTHEGLISVAEQRGAVIIDSHESPLTIRDQRGDVTIDTHEGRMDLRRITGRLSVDTHEGTLTVEALDGGLRFDSHDGRASVAFSGLSDDVYADTHDGDVTLTLPSGTGFDLVTDFDDDADLRSDFDLRPIRLRDDDEDEVNYRGDINGGGPEIRFESHDGTFTVRSR